MKKIQFEKITLNNFKRIKFSPYFAKGTGFPVNYDAYYDFVIDGVLPQMIIFPIIPLTYTAAFFRGEYGLTRYIGGFDGDVVVCNTHKCM